MKQPTRPACRPPRAAHRGGWASFSHKNAVCADANARGPAAGHHRGAGRARDGGRARGAVHGAGRRLAAVAAVVRPTRAAAHMSVATFMSRGIGFVRVWVVAAVLGTTYLGNTYQSSSSISNVLFELLAAGALSAVLVPTFVALLDAGEQERAERLAAGMIGIGLLAMGVVSVVGIVFAPQIARLLASGAPTPEIQQQQIELSTFLLYFFVPQVCFYVLGHGRHGHPVREEALRDHRSGSHREHRVRGRVARPVLGHGRLGARSRPDAQREARPRCRRAARRHRLRRRAGRRARARRLPVRAVVAGTRPAVASDALALGVGGVPTCRCRSAAARVDRDGQPGRGRRRGVPVRVRRVPRAVRDPGAAGADDHPHRGVTRRVARRPHRVRRPGPVGAQQHRDAWCSPSRPRTSPWRSRRWR